MSQKTVLENLYSAYPDPIDLIASNWLELGAKTAVLSSDGKILAKWGNPISNPETWVAETIRIGSQEIGDLRVAIDAAHFPRNRLELDARTIATLAQQNQSLTNTAIELVDTRDQLLAFYEITRATRDSWEIEETMDLILVETTKMVKAEVAFLVVDMKDGFSHIVQTPSSILDKDTLFDWAKQVRIEGQFILLENSSKPAHEGGVQNMLLMPIRIFDESTGVLGIVHKSGLEFMSPDIKLMNAISEFAGTRLEIVIMYKQNIEQAKLQTEMALAHDVQNQLLPKKPPFVEGLDLWASYQPASQIGGDFYDFISLPGLPFTFSVGDVAGKGIPAALLMTVTRTIMRMAIKQGQDFSPQTILRRSNKALYEDLTSLSMIVTAFVAQYLPATQDFIFANAGHSPVIYLPANGTAQLINANETALGVFPTTTFKNQHLRLKPGDIVFIGSDGLWEANNSEDVFNGYEYILRTLEKHAHQPAEIIAGAVLDAGKNLSIGPYQEDDQTLMVVKKVVSF